MDQEKKNAVPEQTPEVKSGKKRLRRILSIAGIAVVVLVIFCWLLLDWTVAAAVRNVAPVLTGTPVELKDVRIGILRGRVELVGFKVGNPAGFSRPYAFELDRFVCKVDLPSALSDKIVVEEVSIHGMLADYEVGLDGSNLAIIQKNVESFTGKAAAANAKDADAPEEEDAKPAKKVVIRKLRVDGVALAMGVAKMPLPPISMDNLGDGKSLGEVVNDFYVALMKAVADAVSSQVVQGVGDAAKGVGNAAADAAKGVGNAAADAAKGVGDAAADAGKSAVDAVTNIFKKK